MNRFRRAWLALIGKLEPEEIVVPGDANAGQLFVADYYDWTGGIHGFRYLSERRWYFTCEQAFAENPGKEIKAVDAFRISGEWYVKVRGFRVDVQPKPKVAKGKR